MTVCPVSMLQATFSLSASLISSKTATSCSRRKCWSGTECSWVNSSPYEIRGISRQHRAGMLAGTYTSVRTKTNTQLAVDWSGNPKIHSQGCAGQIKVMQCDEVMMGLPWDTAVSQGIMGVKEEEVKLWKTVKGVAEHCESLGVSLSVSVFGLKGWFILIWWVWESVSYVMSRSVTLRVTTLKMKSCSDWCNSPTDPRFLCVPGIHAPPSRCPGWGCRGSDLQRASCWADWATASPSRPAPPSAHHLDVLKKRKNKKQEI